MTALEVCLVAIGLIAIAISYFISEKTAEERMKKAVDELILSEETKRTLIKQAKDTVGETLNNMSEEVAGKAEVQLEKLSNEKIMMVHEYVDTVLEEIRKNHQEVMFLYSMLDEKDTDVKKTVREAQKLVKTIREWNNQTQKYTANQGSILMDQEAKAEKSFGENQEETFDNSPEQRLERVRGTRRRPERELDGYQEETLERNSERSYKRRARKKTSEKKEETAEQRAEGEHYLVQTGENRETVLKSEDKKRDAILTLYQQGFSNLEIAKELELAMGEVKLVIDLYYASE